MPFASTNPATGETVRTFEPHTSADVERLVARAHRAAQAWRREPVAARAAVVRRAGELLDERRDEYARLMTLEMGKLLGAAGEEAAKCASACRWYADNAARIVAPRVVHDEGGERGTVRHDPLGVVLAVMPWNFPFWQVVRFAAPALCAGNVGLLKHASNVPQCALALERLFLDAGAPEGVFTALLVDSDAVGGLIGDDRVAAVTLTGSEGAGRSVGAAAGSHVKKSVLELGGSDAFIVLDSADVARAATVAVTARTINAGQSCIAAKRFIATDAVYDEFAHGLVEGMRALRVGDPADPRTQLGPLATPRLRDELHAQVSATVAAGARVLLGGHPLDGAGAYYAATVLADVPPGSPAYADELFGPVAALFRVPDADAAVRLANDHRYGLGASIWTQDRAEAARLSPLVEAGSVFVNAMVASDPRYPFGGVKKSGYGRELGDLGLREFTNVKTVREWFGGGGGASTTE